MHDLAVEILLTTLKEERAALRSGKFERLLDLEEQKTAQLQVLERKLPPRADLRNIRSKLGENQKLFSAEISGAKAARDRIEALHNVRAGLKTYDKSGAKAPPNRTMKHSHFPSATVVPTAGHDYLTFYYLWSIRICAHFTTS